MKLHGPFVSEVRIDLQMVKLSITACPIATTKSLPSWRQIGDPQAARAHATVSACGLLACRHMRQAIACCNINPDRRSGPAARQHMLKSDLSAFLLGGPCHVLQQGPACLPWLPQGCLAWAVLQSGPAPPGPQQSAERIVSAAGASRLQAQHGLDKVPDAQGCAACWCLREPTKNSAPAHSAVLLASDNKSCCSRG